MPMALLAASLVQAQQTNLNSDRGTEAFVTSRQSVPVVSVLEGKTTTGVFVKLGPKGGWLTESLCGAFPVTT
ncbi:MAG TPA: hypothetical protein VLI55_00835 [Bryobacteraceae bacterium]|nr:hypothetical protein [Bryobacteraceae bacterium]